MNPETLAGQLRMIKIFFDRSTACLTEEDSTFAPVAGMKTVAQQVAHVAQTVDWFFEGAFRPEGFDMNFEKLEAGTAEFTSLVSAREWLDRSFAAAQSIILKHSAEEWARPLPAGPVMGGEPRLAVISALNDHTAHHRGALAVCARLRGHVPAMPYA